MPYIVNYKRQRKNNFYVKLSFFELFNVIILILRKSKVFETAQVFSFKFSAVTETGVGEESFGEFNLL
jgi:hypothetical protein